MYNTHLQEMIQTGQFGATSPMQQTGYNPYMNQQQPYSNIVPFGGYQQPSNNGFIFQPVQNTNYQYSYYQAPKYDYYNPYGAPQQYQYNYQNPYAGYTSYGGYRPFISPMQQERMIGEQVELMKIKHRIVNAYFHKDVPEEELDKQLNPQNKVNMPTFEEQKNEQEYRFMQYLSYLATQPQIESMAEHQAKILRQMSENMHRELDNHSLCQFLEDDLWRLEREEWIRKYINRNQGRNLSATYNSNDYNELLKMHRSSNPYINELLNTSHYDNNIDDYEMGMGSVYDRARRRQAILEGKVPSFISSEETQKRRAEWTNQIMQQIYKKGGNINV